MKETGQDREGGRGAERKKWTVRLWDNIFKNGQPGFNALFIALVISLPFHFLYILLNLLELSNFSLNCAPLQFQTPLYSITTPWPRLWLLLLMFYRA